MSRDVTLSPDARKASAQVQFGVTSNQDRHVLRSVPHVQGPDAT